jgi:hypothetical protein
VVVKLLLWHEVRIAGQNVDEWVIEVRADQANEPESDKVTVVLANTYGQWSGAFQTKDELNIILGHEIWKATYGEPELVEVRQDQILKGEVQYIEYKDDEVLIEGACLVGTLADALPREFHFHPSDVPAIINTVLDSHDKDIDREIDITQDIKRREEVFKPDWKYQDVLNHLAELVGATWYVREDGVLVFIDPMKQGATNNIDLYLMREAAAHTCVGSCNKVKVIGGGVYPPDDVVGSYIETTKTIRSDDNHGNDYESQEKNGLLIAPTFYCPYLTTIEQCNTRADNLIEWYKTKEDIAKPVVSGIAVPLQDILVYSLWGAVQEVLVTKRTIEYSAGGYETHFEASKGAVGASYSEMPEEESE